MCGCRRTASVAGTRARVSSNSVPHAGGRAARRAEGRDQRNIRAADTDIVRTGSGYLDSWANDELIDWQVAGATARGLARPAREIPPPGDEQAVHDVHGCGVAAAHAGHRLPRQWMPA